MSLGKYISKMRKDKGLTLREAAGKIGISHPYLSQLENGHNDNPSKEVLQKISKSLDIDYFKLLNKAGYLTYIDEVDLFGEKNNPYIFKKTDSNGVTSYKELSLNEIKKLTDIHENLTLDIDNYYKGKKITDEEKKKILTLLQTILE